MSVPKADIDWSFETPRLQARLVDHRDRDLYRDLYTDPAVMAHIGTVMSDSEADAVFEKVLGYNAEMPVRARYWRLSDRGTDDAIGIQSCIRPIAEPASLELGMMLLPQKQGCGLGVEASRRFIELLLGNRWGLDIEAVFARHTSANARVARLGATLGFDRTAQIKRPIERSVSTGEEWRLSREEWLVRAGKVR